jgi:hypothetical protein
MWNCATNAYYCVKCARLINTGGAISTKLDRTNGIICHIDEEKMAYEKNDKLKIGMSWAVYQQSEKIKEN